MALKSQLLQRVPITSSIIYMFLGITLGKHGFNLLPINAEEHHTLIEIVTEITVIVALFTVGLKLRLPLSDQLWKLPLTLATLSMVITIFLIAAISHYFLKLNHGEAILLGAILAPTDLVLASEVQLEGPKVDSRLKFSLSTEGGLNDGTAFPFIMLGLGIMTKNNAWSFTDWVQIDLIWAVVGGLGIGTILGFVIFKIANYVKSIKHNYYLEDFLTIGSIALSYGLAIQFKTYGFLAVFANALTFRQLELKKTGSVKESPKDELPDEVLSFNEQLERIFEVVSVVLLGTLINLHAFSLDIFLFALTLFLIIRPLAVFAGTSFARSSLKFSVFTSWFGVRGIGSVYYLFYALNHKSFSGNSEVLLDITLWVLFLSIVIHGLSTKPLMKIWNK